MIWNVKTKIIKLKLDLLFQLDEDYVKINLNNLKINFNR